MALRVALAVAAAAFLAKKAFVDRGSSPAEGTVSRNGVSVTLSL